MWFQEQSVFKLSLHRAFLLPLLPLPGTPLDRGFLRRARFWGDFCEAKTIFFCSISPCILLPGGSSFFFSTPAMRCDSAPDSEAKFFPSSSPHVLSWPPPLSTNWAFLLSPLQWRLFPTFERNPISRFTRDGILAFCPGRSTPLYCRFDRIALRFREKGLVPPFVVQKNSSPSLYLSPFLNVVSLP